MIKRDEEKVNGRQYLLCLNDKPWCELDAVDQLMLMATGYDLLYPYAERAAFQHQQHLYARCILNFHQSLEASNGRTADYHPVVIAHEDFCLLFNHTLDKLWDQFQESEDGFGTWDRFLDKLETCGYTVLRTYNAGVWTPVYAMRIVT
jgi:hypothetical protein